MLSPSRDDFRGPLPNAKASGEPGEVFSYGNGAAAVQDSGRGVEIERPYTVYVMEDEGSLARQIRVCRTALWGYLGIAGAVLLLLQTLVLRWSLWPLRNVVNELKRVQRGQAIRMGEHHPRKLEPLTASINALVESERENLDHQRNTMSDLAHRLTTPLAVLRTRLDNDARDAELQIGRAHV